MFNSKIKYLPKRPGERYASALINKNLSNKIYKFYGKISLKKYIKSITKWKINDLETLSNFQFHNLSFLKDHYLINQIN